MHPKPFFVFALLLYVHFSFGQAPSLTYNTSVPLPGDSIAFYLCNSVGPGNAGANITWNFSNLTFKYGASSMAGEIFHSCQPNLLCNTFPGSQLILTNYANTSFGNYTEYECYITDTSKISENGIEYWATPLYVYTDSKDILRFPFTYNDSFSDSYSYYSYYSTSSITNGSVEVKADAYGMLILPYDTFTNVIRVYTHDTLVGPSNQLAGYETYTWYSTGERWPLLIITWNTTGIVDTQVTYYQKVVPGTYIPQISKAGFSLNIYPNPVQDQLNIDFDNPGTSNIHISLMDMLGREIDMIANKNFSAGKQHIQYTLHDLAKGVYLVRLQSEQSIATKKIEVL